MLFGGIFSVEAAKVPLIGPVLICPNHLSDCDPLAVYVTLPRRDVAFMAKDELFHLPMLGPAIRWIGAFPVKRETADRAAIHAAVRVLRGNRALVMFPEGRLSESGLLGTVHPGAAMIAIRSGAPILPVALARTNSFLPYGHVVPQRSRLPARVFFGKPIHPSAVAHLRGRAATDELTRLLETELSRLTGQSCGG